MPITAKTYARPEPVPVATKVPFAFVHVNKCGGSSIEIALGVPKAHLPAWRMREILGPEEWARRFTFGVVRNPFDRAVSIYYYRVRVDHSGLSDRALNVNQWIMAVWGDRDPQYLDEPLLLAPCYDWVMDDQEQIVDYVAKIETLATDWPVICDRLGIDVPLQMTNWNRRPPYRSVLTDESRAILEDAFADDLKQFGYCY